MRVCVCVLGRGKKPLSDSLWTNMRQDGRGGTTVAAPNWRGGLRLPKSESHFNCSISQPCNSFHVPRCSPRFYAGLQLRLSLSPAGSLDTLLLRPHKHTSVPCIFFFFCFLPNPPPLNPPPLSEDGLLLCKDTPLIPTVMISAETRRSCF